MDNEEIKPLLVKYITGEADPADIVQVKEWINAHPENEQYFAQLYETWHNMLYVQPQVNKDNAFQQFLPAPAKRYVQLVKWGKVAAVAALFVALSAALFNRYTSNTGKIKQIAVSKGAVKKVVLSDGTLVWLNAGSKLNYNADFGKMTRTVFLEGEAFFDIAPGKKTIPFIVNTQNYTIRDIGTKFNLKAYPNDPFFETTVVKGEVAVEGNINGNARENNRIYVKPRQVLRIYYRPETDNYKPDVQNSKIYNEIQVLQVDSAKLSLYDGWKENLLVFDGNTLEEISKILERRYDVRIRLDDESLKSIRYSGSFKNVAGINKVLDIIKANTAIDYSINGNTVNITKN
ncbi:FecR family protein [Mucilaginibacter xinganensis]|nr:FecR domain-containing protein [Mucilaginibacter xinganensis]